MNETGRGGIVSGLQTARACALEGVREDVTEKTFYILIYWAYLDPRRWHVDWPTMSLRDVSG